MRHQVGPPQNFAGQLLVAHPSMRDPNFRRTVLFISSHNEAEGAVGLIINRPLDKQVSELVNDEAPAGLAEVPVFLGGPVGTNQLMFASFDWKNRDTLSLNQNVAIEEAYLLTEEDRSALRAFVGYAGWSAGQLENELRQNAWVLRKPDRSVLRPERLPHLWFEIMRSLGPWFKMLAAAPDDPSLN
jgi:putative transcriptional regulator